MKGSRLARLLRVCAWSTALVWAAFVCFVAAQSHWRVDEFGIFYQRVAAQTYESRAWSIEADRGLIELKYQRTVSTNEAGVAYFKVVHGGRGTFSTWLNVMADQFYGPPWYLRPLHAGFGAGKSETDARDYRITTHAVAIPWWLLLAPPVMFLFARLVRAVRRRRRQTAGLCPTCGYDLRATPERCPECGRQQRSAGA